MYCIHTYFFVPICYSIFIHTYWLISYICMYRKETHLTALAMGTSWLNWAHQQKGNLKYRMLRKKTQSLNLFNLQLEILCCWWEMAPLFCYHVPRHLWETEESTPGKNNWQTIKSSLSTSSDQFILYTPTDSFSVLLSILPFQAGWIFAPKNSEATAFFVPPKVAQAINQPSAETMKPAPVQRIGSGDPVFVDLPVLIWASWCKLTFGEFEILTFQVDSNLTTLTTLSVFFCGGTFGCVELVLEKGFLAWQAH